MAQKALGKTKLQQDDPSIIHCAENNSFKRLSFSATSSKDKSTIVQPVKKETRPKTVPVTRNNSQKKSEPMNINSSKHWQYKNSGAPYHGRGYYSQTYPYQNNDYHQKSGSYRPKKINQSRIADTSPSKCVESRVKNVSNQSSENYASIKTSNSIRKTGTPIDNLMHGKLAPSFSNSKSIKSTPKPLQQLLPKDGAATKVDVPLPISKLQAGKLNDTSKSFITADYKSRVENDVKQVACFKDQYEQSRNGNAKEKKNRRKPKNSKPKRNKAQQSLTTEKITDAKAADQSKSGQTRVNMDAGKSILQLVNGGSKAVENPKVGETASHTEQKQDKANSTLSVEKSSSRLPTATVTKDSQHENEKPAVKENTNSPKKLPAEKAQKPTSKQSVRSVPVSKKQLSDVDLQEAERLKKLALDQAAQRFKKDFLILLKKAPAQHPNAKFFCKLCVYHMDDIPIAHRHIKDKKHKKNVKDHQQDEFLRNLIMPAEDALEEINSLLFNKVLNGKILDNDDLQLRKSVVQKLDDLIRKELPDCKVVLYGSSLTGFGFKDSDVNLDLQYPQGIRAPTVLLKVLNIIKTSDLYVDVEAEFHAKLPKIDFVDKKTQLRLQISTGNELAIQTSRLLRFYAILDERVVQLSMVHRTWARLCRLDLQHDGALPTHSLPIMAIFYMQRKNFIPVLHEKIFEWDMDQILASNLKCQQLQFKGSDWWYHPTPPPDEENSSDDADAADESDSDDDSEVIFALQETSIDLSHLSNTDVGDVVLKFSESFSKPILLRDNCVGARLSLAALWLELLRFYALQYPIESEIISIRSSESIKREDKKWQKKRIGMMDPYSMKRNLCRSLNTQGVFTYFMNRLKAAVLYYYKPQLRKTSNNAKTPDQKPSAAKKPTGNKNKLVKYADQLSATVIKNALPRLTTSGLSITETQPPNSPDGLVMLADQILEKVMEDVAMIYAKKNIDDAKQSDAEISTEITTDISKTANSESDLPSDSVSTIEQQLERHESSSQPASPSKESKYCYDFTATVITNSKYPVKVCGLCKKEGHARRSCPEDAVSLDLIPLPPLSSILQGMLDRICYHMFDQYVPTALETRYRDGICDALALYLQRTYNSATRMNLFGSSRNGFGFRGSDLDICMTFDGSPTAENFDSVQVIEEVAKQLRKNKDFWNILPITTAKVPIVKFYHHESRLEGDISLYNILAQRNTAMLKCYSLIDSRCKVLGYVMKVFVKLCNIGDASRGSLSSYAYTLMVIFYLQQKEVPVLPVLQELNVEGKARPLTIVDGWDSWFFDDIGNLANVWDGYNKNTESVGKLWLGLLRFYTEEFNFKRQVVSIRQKKRITTFEKEWTSKFISIEDPFDLNHNLAAGVSHKMATFITQVFVKAREHFGTMPISDLLRGEESDYFFDDAVLMNGQEAPNDRCCRICGKIGHYVRDCPKNKRNKPTGKDGAIGSDRSLIKCFYCGKAGHMKRECPEVQLEQLDEKPHVNDKHPCKRNRTQSNSISSDAVSTSRPQSSEVQSTLPQSKVSGIPLSSSKKSSAEDIFPRSLPADLRLLVQSSNQPPKRLNHRVSESDGSAKTEEKFSTPSPSQGPSSVPLTPPDSFKFCPTFPPPVRPIFPAALYARSPVKGNSDVLLHTASQSNTASVLPPPRPPINVPPPHICMAPIWGFPLNPPSSPSQSTSPQPSVDGNSVETTSPSRRFPVRSPTPLPPRGFSMMPPPQGLSSPPRGLLQELPRPDQANFLRGTRPPPPLPMIPGFRIPHSGLYPVYSQQSSFPTSDSAKASTTSEPVMTSPTFHQAQKFNLLVGQLQQRKEES